LTQEKPSEKPIDINNGQVGKSIGSSMEFDSGEEYKKKMKRSKSKPE
jgi:hypothetical protein